MKKVAFLLFAAAWLTGSAHGHGGSSSCCNSAPSCDPCCEKPGLFDRLRGMFQRNKCGCEAQCAPVCAPSCAPVCAPSHSHKVFHRSDCCQPSCDTGCGRPSLLDKLRSRFSRGNDCCEPCGNACGSSYGPGVIHGPGGGVITPKTGETITTPPKKLPPAGGTGSKTSTDAPTGEVRIITPPASPIITPPATIPTAPGLESRSPF